MDPIGDFLTRIRNGLRAKLREIDVSYSRLKFELSRVLLEEGYISNFRVDGEAARRRIVIILKYLDNGEPVIRGIELVSRQSQRVYRGCREIPRVLGGLGTAILTTPKGVLTDREARRRGVGGEVICKVW